MPAPVPSAAFSIGLEQNINIGVWLQGHREYWRDDEGENKEIYINWRADDDDGGDLYG